MELRDRVAIVTGGATGAGWSIVLRLVDEGVAVVIADVADSAGEAAVAAIVERGGAGSFVRTDVRVDGDVEHMVAFAEERHGGVDILVNNAGGWGPTANYPHASPLQWGSTLDLNLRADARDAARARADAPARRGRSGQRLLDRRPGLRAL